MDILFTSFVYAFLFIVLYFEVFLILTMIENRKHITGTDKAGLSHSEVTPSVTIIVPVFNEESTVAKTVHSLLDLNYPKDKLSVMVVDDGSKDETWKIVQQFSGNPQVLLHTKKNGGKYTALNYGIEHSDSEFIGCLDADSFVDREALNHIIPHFNDPQVMSVTPSMKIQNPTGILTMMQNAEYNLGIFLRKILGILDAQYVTPGPFSIFRKEIFGIVGMYHHAHNTEDLEMALRIQQSHYKIKNAHKALVYTVAPKTIYKLYRQRVRWTGGFMQNLIDYKHLLFNPRYGTFGLLVLPVSILSTAGTIPLLAHSAYQGTESIASSITEVQTVGFHPNWSAMSYDWLVSHATVPGLLGLLSLGIIIFSIWYGMRISGDKKLRFLDFVYFILFYSLISPFWLVASAYNTVRNRDAAWR